MSIIHNVACKPVAHLLGGARIGCDVSITCHLLLTFFMEPIICYSLIEINMDHNPYLVVLI